MYDIYIYICVCVYVYGGAKTKLLRVTKAATSKCYRGQGHSQDFSPHQRHKIHKRYAGYVCAGYVNIIGYPTESMMFPLNPHNFAGKVALSRIQPPFS